MTCIRCARCNLPVKVDGEIGKLRLAIPGNHEPTMGEDSALPAETAVCPGSEHLGIVENSIWVRVGDAGEYESFDSIADALDYLNELNVGKVAGWRALGFNTPNFWGQDYISIYHGTADADALGELTADEKATLESGLVEIFA
jgi:hypothetical protein